MPTKLSRTSPTRGSITPPFPSPPNTALMLEHHVDDVRLADGRAIERHAVLAGHVFRHPAGRAIRDDRPGRWSEHVVDAHRQRVFFAQVAAVLVDDRQPVGVRVLAEADLSAVLA